MKAEKLIENFMSEEPPSFIPNLEVNFREVEDCIMEIGTTVETIGMSAKGVVSSLVGAWGKHSIC